MAVDKLSVSFDSALGQDVRRAARRSGQGLSRWLAEAARQQLRAEALTDFLDAWEAESGPLTQAELTAAAVELGIPAPPPRNRAGSTSSNRPMAAESTPEGASGRATPARPRTGRLAASRGRVQRAP